ncbi:MAG: 4Fe-4S dicluster domain-containing protein [Coriobacteriales bacterium]|jgi:molybdopterin-containing oxidoreductase family iron-sulfur binding subunit|nr:4Fe-4S dicluster domain-containing protein [Coriobacteriales bacterium]
MTRKAMLVDLARCAGCGGCVVACQMQNNTRPDVRWNALDACEWGDYPEARRCYLPHACMQCDQPPCVAACPTGASHTTAEGVTLVDYEKCICCRQCVNACPYGARQVNTGGGNYFGAATPAPYEAYGTQRENVVEKCTFCHELTAAGGEPACVANCPGRARFFGDLEDPASTIAQKVAAGATRVDKTGFYYSAPADIPRTMIASKVSPTLVPSVTRPTAAEQAPPGIDPLVMTAGVAVVAAAVGAVGGYAVASRRAKASGADGAKGGDGHAA